MTATTGHNQFPGPNQLRLLSTQDNLPTRLGYVQLISSSGHEILHLLAMEGENLQVDHQLVLYHQLDLGTREVVIYIAQ